MWRAILHVHYIRIGKRDAERIKRRLIRSRLLDTRALIEHSDSYVYFPTQNISKTTIKKVIGLPAEIVERSERKASGQLGFRERLQKVLSKEEYQEAPKGYDIIGNIATVDVSDTLSKKEKEIAQVIMQIHPSVETVLAKEGAVSGKYRTRKFRHVLGKKNFTATYRENNCTFVFDVRKSFFSNRLSFERSRITRLVKKKENVLVMFAGIGPFAIEIAKAHPDCSVVAIELNRSAYKEMGNNIKLNKVSNVLPVLGDVKESVRKFHGFADRIIMPLPRESISFLDSALAAAKRKSILHVYAFGRSESAYVDVAAAIMANAKKNHYRAAVKSQRVARPYSAKEIEVVLDVAIQKS